MDSGISGSAAFKPTQHFTMIFNAFVLMTLFNEINSRKIHGERNVFKGIFDNPIFYGIWIVTLCLQVIEFQREFPRVIFNLISDTPPQSSSVRYCAFWKLCICLPLVDTRTVDVVFPVWFWNTHLGTSTSPIINSNIFIRWSLV